VGHVEDTMVHELIHAFDNCRTFFNMNDCRQRACSEIRAANLSGECRWSRELLRGNLAFKAQHWRCVERRARLSLLRSDGCQGCDLDKIFNEVWTVCLNDTEPFIDVP